MQLSSHQAQIVIDGAEAKARELGLAVVIAVLDAGAHLKAFRRMDGAVLAAIDLAIRKARRPCCFQVNSEAVWEYCKPGAPAPGLELTNGGLATFGGGIPLKGPDRAVIGPLGVSGGTVSQDVEVALGRLRRLRSSHPLNSQALNHQSPNRERKRLMPKTILITGAGSGFGEGAAIGMAKNGHHVIATVQVSPQVTPLQEKAKALGLENLRVERLDLTDPYDVAYAQTWDIDVLWNNAGMGEAGPVFEIPIDLVRRNYEVNVFLPLQLTQGFVRKWIDARKTGKIVFTSSMGGLFTPANWGVYVSTKHALESVAEALQQELKPHGIKVQTINPGAFYTGYNETMADAPFRWLDDSKNITKRAALRQEYDSFLQAPDGHLDAREMIDRMIEIVPADTGKFRNVVPKATEDMLKAHQIAAWDNQI